MASAWDKDAAERIAEGAAIFYDAPPTSDPDILGTFKRAAPKGTEVVVPARIIKGGEGTYAGFTISWKEKTSVDQRALNEAWATYYGNKASVEAQGTYGKTLVCKDDRLYPGQYFPYLLSGRLKRLDCFLPGNPPDDYVETEKLEHQYAVSLQYSDPITHDSKDTLNVAAQVFPQRDDDLPLVARINEPSPSKSDEYNAEYESYTVPSFMTTGSNIMFFPSVVVGSGNRMSIAQNEEILTSYGKEFPRDDYQTVPHGAKRSRWEYIINYVYWKDKWHKEIELPAEEPQVRDDAGCDHGILADSYEVSKQVAAHKLQDTSGNYLFWTNNDATSDVDRLRLSFVQTSGDAKEVKHFVVTRKDGFKYKRKRGDSWERVTKPKPKVPDGANIILEHFTTMLLDSSDTYYLPKTRTDRQKLIDGFDVIGLYQFLEYLLKHPRVKINDSMRDVNTPDELIKKGLALRVAPNGIPLTFPVNWGDDGPLLFTQWLDERDKKAFDSIRKWVDDGSALLSGVQVGPVPNGDTISEIMNKVGINSHSWEQLMWRHQTKFFRDLVGPSDDPSTLDEQIMFPTRLEKILEGWIKAYPPLTMCIVRPRP